eukprot:scaffold722_cov158-Chaetoceros_neogracile.AAC.2
MLFSPWGTNIPVCLAYHINSKCHDGCESEADHRPLSPVNAQRLLKWCEIQMNPKFVCDSWSANLFHKFNVANLNSPQKKKKKSFPSSPRDINVPMCLAYHIYGKCSKSSCESIVDHRSLSPENAQRLLKWCESESLTYCAGINSSYQADMFKKFKIAKLKIDKKTMPSSPWDMNVPMCLTYHINSRCSESSCESIVDHRALSPENAQRLLKWCESASLAYCAGVNSSYQADMFGKFKAAKLKIHKKTIPTSPWDMNVPMCLEYHIDGRCSESSCESIVDHRALPPKNAQRLLKWCESLKIFKCKNSSYQADVFGKFKVAKLKKDKKTIPTSPWDNRIPMCLAYHICGQCSSSCNSVMDHHALSRMNTKCLFDWCEKSDKAV